MSTALLDIHDAPSLFTHLSQVIPGLAVASTNDSGLPDFSFLDYKNEWVGISLKGVGEVLSGLDQVTEQLQRDVRNVSRLYLVVTGVMIPVEGGVETLDQGGQKAHWFQHGRRYGHERVGIDLKGMPYHFSYLGYRKWIETLDLYGISVREPANRAAQVTTLQALYDWHQCEPESHTSFAKVVRTKMNLPEDASPFVRSLMGLADATTGRTFIGEETAKAIEAHGWSSLQQLVHEMETEDSYPQLEDGERIKDAPLASGRRIGPAMAKRIKEALG